MLFSVGKTPIFLLKSVRICILQKFLTKHDDFIQQNDPDGPTNPNPTNAECYTHRVYPERTSSLGLSRSTFRPFGQAQNSLLAQIPPPTETANVASAGQHQHIPRWVRDDPTSAECYTHRVLTECTSSSGLSSSTFRPNKRAQNSLSQPETPQ